MSVSSVYGQASEGGSWTKEQVCSIQEGGGGYRRKISCCLHMSNITVMKCSRDTRQNILSMSLNEEDL